mgnify:CR=1 FL=1
MNELDPHFISIREGKDTFCIDTLASRGLASLSRYVRRKGSGNRATDRTWQDSVPVRSHDCGRNDQKENSSESSSHTLRVVYQSGLAQHQVREEKITKDIKAGKDRKELLDEYLKRGKTEAIGQL